MEGVGYGGGVRHTGAGVWQGVGGVLTCCVRSQ